jgi:hypothetical protein
MIEEKGLTFKPRLNENSLNFVESSLIQRNEEFVKNKNIKLKNYVKNEDLECTFTPQIRRIATEQDQVSVEQRLFNYNQIYREKKEAYKESLNETYAFKPEINKNTEEILRKKKEILEQIKHKFDNTSPKENSGNRSNDINYYLDEQQRKIGLKNHNNNEIHLLTDENVAEERRETETFNNENNDLNTNQNLNSNNSIKELNSQRIDSQRELNK